MTRKMGMRIKGRLWRSYLVLGSVGRWIRRRIKLQVRVEELNEPIKGKERRKGVARGCG